MVTFYSAINRFFPYIGKGVSTYTRGGFINKLFGLSDGYFLGQCYTILMIGEMGTVPTYAHPIRVDA